MSYLKADYFRKIISVSEYNGSVIQEKMKFSSKDAMEKYLKAMIKANKKRGNR